jgi:hypothetical protein
MVAQWRLQNRNSLRRHDSLQKPPFVERSRMCGCIKHSRLDYSLGFRIYKNYDNNSLG